MPIVQRMTLEDGNDQRGTSGRPRNTVLAALLAFVMPGLLLGLVSVVLPDVTFAEGQARPHGLYEWAASVGGLVLAAALFNAPIVVADLLLWSLLDRLHLCRLWVFSIIGVVSGLAWPVLLGSDGRAPASMYLVFAMAGLLTASSVWAVAYGRRSYAVAG